MRSVEWDINEDFTPIISVRPAFSEPVRRKIFARDNGTCVRCNRSFAEGYLIDCSHKPEVVGVPHNRKHPAYDDPNTGQCLCVACHAEADKADPNASYLLNKRLRETQGGRTRKWLEEHK